MTEIAFVFHTAQLIQTHIHNHELIYTTQKEIEIHKAFAACEMHVGCYARSSESSVLA